MKSCFNSASTLLWTTNLDSLHNFPAKHHPQGYHRHLHPRILLMGNAMPSPVSIMALPRSYFDTQDTKECLPVEKRSSQRRHWPWSHRKVMQDGRMLPTGF